MSTWMGLWLLASHSQTHHSPSLLELKGSALASELARDNALMYHLAVKGETQMQESLRTRLEGEIDALKEKHLYRKLRVVHGAEEPLCNIDGKMVINLSSNNYLGLTTHPKLKEAARRAVDTHGVGTAAVRSIIGTMDLHEELETRVAKFKHTEASLTFQSGFATNQAIIQALLEE